MDELKKIAWIARRLGLEPSFYLVQLRALTVRLKLDFSSLSLWPTLWLFQSWLLWSPRRVMKTVTERDPTLLDTDWGGQKGCHPPSAEHHLETRVFFLAGYATVQNSYFHHHRCWGFFLFFLPGRPDSLLSGGTWDFPLLSSIVRQRGKSRLNCPQDLWSRKDLQSVKNESTKIR